MQQRAGTVRQQERRGSNDGTRVVSDGRCKWHMMSHDVCADLSLCIGVTRGAGCGRVGGWVGGWEGGWGGWGGVGPAVPVGCKTVKVKNTAEFLDKNTTEIIAKYPLNTGRVRPTVFQ